MLFNPSMIIVVMIIFLSAVIYMYR